MIITFSYNKKSKRFTVPIEQRPHVKSYNKYAPDDPEYKIEHRSSAPKADRIGFVVDAMLACGYTVTVVGDPEI